MVSIIIPAYNSEKYMRQCLESALMQTYQQIEIIVVDDGSSDSTGRIADEFAEKYPNIIVEHTVNRGVCEARNRGIELAQGQYLMFLDSDDRIYPDAVETLLGIICEYDADICHGVVARVWADSARGRVIDHKSIQVWDGETALQKSIQDHPATYSSCAKLYRADFLKDLRFHKNIRVHEDSFFLFNCFLKKPKMVVTQEAVYQYTLNYNSVSHSAFSEKFLDILYLADEKMKLVQEKFPVYIREARNIPVKAHMALLMLLVQTYDNKWKSVERDSLKYVRKHRSDFQPMSRANRIWFFIIVTRLYSLYKMYIWARRKISNRKKGG